MKRVLTVGVLTAALAGIEQPVVPLKHSLFVFSCREDLGQALPLTIDPAGIHCRSEGEFYLAPNTTESEPSFFAACGTCKGLC